MKKYLLVIAAALSLLACEKENEKKLTISNIRVEPESNSAPTKVLVIYDQVVENYGILSIYFEGAVNEYGEQDSTTITSSGNFTLTDTLELYYENSGSYQIVFQVHGGATSIEEITLGKGNKELLVGRKWVSTKAISTDPNGNKTNLMEYMYDYKKDDYYIYNTDGTFKVYEGATKENPGDPDIFIEGVWTLEGVKQDSLRMQNDDINVVLEQLEISGNTISCIRIDREPSTQEVTAVNDLELSEIE